MVRVLVGGLSAGNGDQERETPEDRAGPVARRLRDGGHEVVLVSPSVSPERLAAAAVQEDVVAVALASGVDHEAAGELVELLASYGAGDIVVFAADQAVGAKTPD